MNVAKNIAIGFGFAAASIGIYDTIKTEQKKRADLKIKTEKEIAAIKNAGEIVRKMIQEDEIRTTEEAMNAVKFYTIVLMNE